MKMSADQRRKIDNGAVGTPVFSDFRCQFNRLGLISYSGILGGLQR
jgi:hypothetical protein